MSVENGMLYSPAVESDRSNLGDVLVQTGRGTIPAIIFGIGRLSQITKDGGGEQDFLTSLLSSHNGLAVFGGLLGAAYYIGSRMYRYRYDPLGEASDHIGNAEDRNLKRFLVCVGIGATSGYILPFIPQLLGYLSK